MQYSKSFAYFALPDQQRQPSTQTRALRRSSLDTFVIPGRTRLPSCKTSTFDLRVTQGLLNTNPPQHPRRTMTSTESQEWSPETSPARCLTRRGGSSGSSGPLHKRARPDNVRRPPPRFGGREVIIVPPQRPRPHTHQPAPQALAPRSSQEYIDDVQKYDGAHDSNTESRLTSTTWSTVSHRFFSDSSGSSRTQGASYYKGEYNKLAEKYGLPRLEAILDQDENHSQTKTTTKTHHAGWLARKLFRRTSSTYTLKAKTTYKPISKKKSFGGISVLSEDRHKNIIKGKSLEELSRLGGLSVLILPPDFAVDKLTLPTCLSATATYLYQHGRNAPGIFRVSGQATIVNALYDFYDHQFANADAGSPSKVEQTVGSGLLPSHIEHTVPDVASFFKKVLIDLPGGLLGSVELFEALRNITMNFEHDHDLSELELASLKAKMIALAISSVTSDYRLYLIQAVLGLVSYLGHEAQKVQAEASSGDEDQAASELMNYRSLGVVMGPLLLGNLTDRAVHGSPEGHGGDPRTPLETDSGKKFRKHKRKHSDLKLDQNATLAASVDRANRTAIVMQQLLSMWPKVVKQLRDISTTASSSLKSGSRTRLKMPSHTGSRLTLKTSEEEMRFLDILRGRTLPEDFHGGVRMKSAIRVTSRSPMSRGPIIPSGGEHANDNCAAAPGEDHLSLNSDHTRIAERAVQDNELAVSSKLQFIEEKKPLLTDEVALSAENRTLSDIAMDKMAMGTILPPLRIKRSSSSHNEHLHLVGPTIETPRDNRNSSPSSETPQTALRDAPLMGHSHEAGQSQLEISMRKPLPPIGDAQKAELSCLTSEDMVLEPPSRPFARHERPTSPQRNNSSSISSSNSFSSRQARRSGERAIFFQSQSGQFRSPPAKHMDDQAIFPPRQSSLPTEQHLSLNPIETHNTLAEHKAKADTYMSPPRFNVSRKASEVRTEGSDVRPKPNNVKALAQRFTEASRAMRKNNEQPNETAIPRIYAFVNSLPSPKSPMLGIDDPFLSAESSNLSKESLIPKPVRDIGRTRESKPLSPPKRAAPKVHTPSRRSAFGIVTDSDAEIMQNNATVNASAVPHSGEGQTYNELNIKSNVTGSTKRPSTQHLDAYHHQRSTESLRRRTSLQEPPNEPHPLHDRAISFVELVRPISPHRPDSPSLNVYNNPKKSSPRSNSYLNASDALKPLERHGSINATMYREICRLQRLLQQMGEEKEAKDRRIEALEEVQGVNPVAIGVKTRGSFGKGGLHNEVRKAKRETSLWKMRAELLERRLSGLKQLSDQSLGNETGYAEDTEAKEKTVFVNEQDGENDTNNVQNSQGHSADSWKERAIMAERQLIQIGKRECPNKEFDVYERHRDSPNFWKRPAILAEIQLDQNAPLTGKGQHSETVRTVPSPNTAKVHVAVETENGEEEVGFWNWRGAEGRSPDNGDDSLTEDEKEAERRPGAVKRARGSDDASSDFASGLNGFG